MLGNKAVPASAPVPSYLPYAHCAWRFRGRRSERRQPRGHPLAEFQRNVSVAPMYSMTFSRGARLGRNWDPTFSALSAPY